MQFPQTSNLSKWQPIWGFLSFILLRKGTKIYPKVTILPQSSFYKRVVGLLKTVYMEAK